MKGRDYDRILGLSRHLNARTDEIHHKPTNVRGRAEIQTRDLLNKKQDPTKSPDSDIQVDLIRNVFEHFKNTNRSSGHTVLIN
jgi:hypothetical protein